MFLFVWTVSFLSYSFFASLSGRFIIDSFFFLFWVFFFLIFLFFRSVTVLFHVVIFYFSWQSLDQGSLSPCHRCLLHTFITKIKESRDSFSLAALALAHMCINFWTPDLPLTLCLSSVVVTPQPWPRRRFCVVKLKPGLRKKTFSGKKWRDSLNRHIVSSLIRGKNFTRVNSCKTLEVKCWDCGIKLSICDRMKKRALRS